MQENIIEKKDCPTSVFAVANWFIKKSIDMDKPMTHMKLQKLVYMAYGWYYACYEIPLFGNDIVAWKHGPVVPSLYAVFKDNGQLPVKQYAIKLTEDDNGNPEIIDYSIYFSDKELQSLSEQEQQERKKIENGIEKIKYGVERLFRPHCWSIAKFNSSS
jgi:uncharacterized phage-associated protein